MDRRRYFSAGLGVLAFACTVSLPALSMDPFELDRFPVHPSGADESTSSLSVVDTVDSGFRAADVRDLFHPIPGVHLSQAGGPGGRSTLYLRGADENHVAVYLDGVQLNDPTNTRGGAVDFSLLSPASISRIAVVRGPASVRYGPEAVAGVVHLESLPILPHRAVMASAGGDAFHRFKLSYGTLATASTDIGLVALNDADGRDASGGSSERSAFRAQISHQGPIDIEGAVWFARQESTSFPDDSGGLRYAVLRDLETRQQSTAGASTRLSRSWGEWTVSLRGDFSQFDTEIESPGVLPGERDPMGLPASVEDNRFRRSRTQLMAESAEGALSWTGGFDLQRESGRASGALFYGPVALPTDFHLTRDRLGLFGEMSTELPADIELKLGARADRYSGQSWQSTFRAGLLGELGANGTWRLHVGNAFKPPSFYALSNPLVGNPSLRPETSRTYEVGYRHALESWDSFLDFTVYTSRSRDQVEFSPGPPPRMVNLDSVKADGAELALHWQAHGRLQLTASVGYVDAKVRQTGESLRGRPKWNGGIGARWSPLSHLHLGLRLTAVDRVLDSSIPTGPRTMGGWTRLDFDLEWELKEDLRLLLAIDNLLDSEYEEAVGFVSPERRFRAGVEMRF